MYDMDNKIKKAETWDEFHTNFNEYIILLSDMKERGEEYDLLVIDWAEYSAVNKFYLHGGPRYVKDDVNKQMMSLLVENYPILDYYLDIFFHGRKNRGEKKTLNFSQLRDYVDIELEWKETLRKEEEEYSLKKNIST